jgi:hypothetical protein
MYGNACFALGYYVVASISSQLSPFCTASAAVLSYLKCVSTPTLSFMLNLEREYD